MKVKTELALNGGCLALGRRLSRLKSDKFLGSWEVEERVFAANGAAIGTVLQKRDLFTHEADQLMVKQHCSPIGLPAKHPMNYFSGSFEFLLQKAGRQRHYIGPDVHGYGTSFGGDFLCGQGVWPRLQENFVSWSIMLEEKYQLTGGTFFQGKNADAVIVGFGRAAEAVNILKDRDFFGTSWELERAYGFCKRLCIATDQEEILPIKREKLSHDQWVEHGAGFEVQYALKVEDRGLKLIANGKGIGMAHRYGPMVMWEIHDGKGGTVEGLEVSSPLGKKQYALRRHYQYGCLKYIEGMEWNCLEKGEL